MVFPAWSSAALPHRSSRRIRRIIIIIVSSSKPDGPLAPPFPTDNYYFAGLRSIYSTVPPTPWKPFYYNIEPRLMCVVWTQQPTRLTRSINQNYHGCVLNRYGLLNIIIITRRESYLSVRLSYMYIQRPINSNWYYINAISNDKSPIWTNFFNIRNQNPPKGISLTIFYTI